ncbi:Metalloenzyme, LuxS/M16 peptidase-like protein [Paraphysoderma sedebokerense]|nr:Metalloenzyme, LuxS/M16 peptidase-like protein [Paraphysoderma sedebokerense]
MSQLRSFENIVKPDVDHRAYRIIQLKNNLTALVIHDNETDKASAALDVHVGFLHDPENVQGLAHFCEHMLFMGTEKYPKENDYSEYLAKNGGYSNAFTSLENTNYYFEVKPDAFEGALDRFSQFFISPLFTESATEREMKAVDSEHKKNLQSDSWRLHQLEKALSDPNHPYCKFGTGSLDTLKVDPEKAGLNVRDELMKFHDQYYSANIMKLVVLGRENLDTLTEWVVTKFSGISDKNIAIPGSLVTEHPLTKKQLMRVVKVRPVKDLRLLELMFPTPNYDQWWRSKPQRYLSHLIGHEGEGSLLSFLKKKGWANNLSAGGSSGGYNFASFKISIDLTVQGLENYEDIIEAVFSYIRLLGSSNPHRWIHDEVSMIAELDFKFKEIGNISSYVSRTAGKLQKLYPFEETLAASNLMYEWQPDLVKECLSYLHPENLKITLVSQSFDSNRVIKEKYYGTEYVIEDMSASLKNRLANAPLIPDIYLPKPNPFLPKDINVSRHTLEPVNRPTLISDSEMGRLWHKEDDQFWVPKSFFFFAFRNPLAYATPKLAVQSKVFTELLRDSLTEFSYDAEVAGLSYSLDTQIDGLMLHVAGYSDKLSVLTVKIVEKMKSLVIDPQRFELIKEQVARSYSNWKKEAPYQHALYYLQYAMTERLFTHDEKLEELKGLSVNDVQSFIPSFFSNGYYEALMHGSISATSTKDLINDIGKLINARPLAKSQMVGNRTIVLPPGKAYIYTHPVADENNVNSAIEYFVQVGPISDPNVRAPLSLIAQIAQEPCFDSLRTREQLGYLVFSGVVRHSTMTGFRVLIQSERDSVYLENRIVEFLKKLRTILQSMPDAEFIQHVNSLIAKKTEKDKNLSQQANRYWSYISWSYYDFDQIEDDVDALRKLSLSKIIDFYESHIAPESQYSRKLSVHLRSRRTPSNPHLSLVHSCLNSLGLETTLQDLQSMVDQDLPITEETVENIVRALTLPTQTAEGNKVLTHDELVAELRRAFAVSPVSENKVSTDPVGVIGDVLPTSEVTMVNHVGMFTLPGNNERVDDLDQFKMSKPLSEAATALKNISAYMEEPSRGGNGKIKAKI